MSCSVARTPASPEKSWGSCQNINHLPDSILEHILSFLPTKEAVATSILSKQWRFLWTFVPVLDFRDSPSCKITDTKVRLAFLKFVYRVSIFNRVSALDKFHLNCGIIHGPNFLTTWINVAIFRRYLIREVDISISATRKSEFVKLPSSFFTINKALKVLKLSHGILIDVPNSSTSSSFCFPSLKILHLECVRYANDESVSKLLLGCTALEELVAKRSVYDNVKKFIVNVPTLKTLNISLEFGQPWPVLISTDEYELKINAPMLKYLDIKDSVWSFLHFESVFMNSLIEADIYFNGGTDPFELTKAIHRIVFLTILCHHSMAAVKGDSFPLFRNLIVLHLKINHGGWDAIPQFLENSPTLRDLRLDKNPHIAAKKLEHVPKRLSLFLKTVHYMGFQGDKGELELVGFLLKDARALELVDIKSYKMSLVSNFRFLQKLAEFPRRSDKCKLIFN